MDELSILLVEDEARIADTLRFGLQENGYQVTVAYNGNTGYRLFEEASYGLVILDINLPGINGFDLCKKIRARNADIPVIMLTALNTIDDKIEGYGAGADDYLIKPFEYRELLLKIKVLLRRTASPIKQVGNILSAGDLEIDTDTKHVTRSGQTIALTTKEFQLLEYLLRNKNKVVSRADIAINVWDIDFDTATNVIDVYINYLRNKIDRPFDEKLIQTQVGVGYVLKKN